MTHDELLTKIEAPVHLLMGGDSIPHYLLLDQNKALRAVVELHKPSEPISDDGFITCETCNYEYFREYPYPCETIQAIEAELK